MRRSRGARTPDAPARTHASSRRRVCCWRPTSPTTWWRAACRSARRTKSSAAWCGTCSAKQQDFESCRLDEWRRFSPHFGDDVRAAITPEASVRPRARRRSRRPRRGAETRLRRPRRGWRSQRAKLALEVGEARICAPIRRAMRGLPSGRLVATLSRPLVLEFHPKLEVLARRMALGQRESVPDFPPAQ